MLMRASFDASSRLSQLLIGSRRCNRIGSHLEKMKGFVGAFVLFGKWILGFWSWFLERSELTRKRIVSCSCCGGSVGIRIGIHVKFLSEEMLGNVPTGMRCHGGKRHQNVHQRLLPGARELRQATSQKWVFLGAAQCNNVRVYRSIYSSISAMWTVQMPRPHRMGWQGLQRPCLINFSSAKNLLHDAYSFVLLIYFQNKTLTRFTTRIESIVNRFK